MAATTIALEISSRNSRVAALHKRWDRLRTGLDLILDRGADMADLPSGASGMLCRCMGVRHPLPCALLGVFLWLAVR